MCSGSNVLNESMPKLAKPLQEKLSLVLIMAMTMPLDPVGCVTLRDNAPYCGLWCVALRDNTPYVYSTTSNLCRDVALQRLYTFGNITNNLN